MWSWQQSGHGQVAALRPFAPDILTTARCERNPDLFAPTPCLTRQRPSTSVATCNDALRWDEFWVDTEDLPPTELEDDLGFEDRYNVCTEVGWRADTPETSASTSADAREPI